MKPEFLLLDEPTAFLDKASAEQILLLLQELKGECTILVVSHKENETEMYADKKLLLLELQEGFLGGTSCAVSSKPPPCHNPKHLLAKSELRTLLSVLSPEG